jgi:hypothetical protein
MFRLSPGELEQAFRSFFSLNVLMAIPNWRFGPPRRAGKRPNVGCKYSGADLRAIRARNGVGRPPERRRAAA